MPLLLLGLQRFNLCEHLCLSLSDTLTCHHSPSPRLGGDAWSIDNEQSSPVPTYLASLSLTRMSLPSTIITSKVVTLQALVLLVMIPHLGVPIVLAL